MTRLRQLFLLVVLALTGLIQGSPARAVDGEFRTPEAAVTAYIEAVARQDFQGILAASAAARMGSNFDFVAYTGRLRALVPMTPMPASSPLFIEINKADFTAQIARQLKFLAFGLMTKRAILDAKTEPMDAKGAAEFEAAVNAGRLSGLALVKIGTPNPTRLSSERYQALAVNIAKPYGADTSTERLALVTFEGQHFVIGFHLLLFGQDWAVMSQTSPIAGMSNIGVPSPVTPQDFEERIQ